MRRDLFFDVTQYKVLLNGIIFQLIQFNTRKVNTFNAQ